MLREVVKCAQKLTDDIMEVINPVNNVKLPVVVFVLKNILKQLELGMDDDHKELEKILEDSIGVESHVIEGFSTTVKISDFFQIRKENYHDN